MKSNLKSNKGNKIKTLLIIIICLSQISLFGCSLETKDDEKFLDNTLFQEDEDSTGISATRNSYLEGIEKLESLNLDNIESVGKAFALDLLTEDYERLESIYTYTDEMKDIILSDSTKKNIMFHNLDLGEVEK